VADKLVIVALGRAANNEDEDSEAVEVAAVEALGKLAPACDAKIAAGAVNNLRAVLQREESPRAEKVRAAACRALGQYGKRAASAVAELDKEIGEADDGGECTGSHAARALGKIGAASTIPKLVEYLGWVAAPDDDCNLSKAALDALRGLGRRAVPALKQGLKSKNENVRELSASLLKSIANKK